MACSVVQPPGEHAQRPPAPPSDQNVRLAHAPTNPPRISGSSGPPHGGTAEADGYRGPRDLFRRASCISRLDSLHLRTLVPTRKITPCNPFGACRVLVSSHRGISRSPPPLLPDRPPHRSTHQIPASPPTSSITPESTGIMHDSALPRGPPIRGEGDLDRHFTAPGIR